VRISPATTTVRRGATLRLSVRVLDEDGSVLPGARVTVSTRGRGATGFSLSRTTTTDAAGLAQVTFRPTADFRWYASSSTTSALRTTSPTGLVQVR
jgi:hypothetical protein